MNVAVIGPGHDARQADLLLARQVGGLIAREGWVLLTGGMDGVMEAASRGAREGGGTVVGFLPGLDPDSANRSVDIPLPTGLGEARNVLLINSVRGAICVGGSWGTLVEVAFALRTGKPVVQIGGWRIIKDDGSSPTPHPIVVDAPGEAISQLRALVIDGPASNVTP